MIEVNVEDPSNFHRCSLVTALGVRDLAPRCGKQFAACSVGWARSLESAEQTEQLRIQAEELLLSPAPSAQ